ncbi:MFS transporter [Nonomuraea sp. NPDC050786]|uniref:MFS transporter n=1 Tax=Nonomuraea sp. NPDC050786 TaxID=3154840 RepID=UPI003406C317
MSKSTTSAGAKPPSLFRQRNFALLFTSQTGSLFGTQITYVAVPLTAVLLLHATPLEAGLLGALETLPFLLFGLFVGVRLDRQARRPVMIAADAVRAVALAWIPVAHALGVLNIGQLFAVVFVVGTMTVFFDLALQSYTPGLIGRDRLPEANAKMQVSDSAAQVAGPGAAGVLISAIGAPTAILVDAASYVLSFLAVAGLPADKTPEPRPGARSGSIRASIREGFAAIGRHPMLRWPTSAAVTVNLFSGALMSVFFLYLVHVGMDAAQVGLIVAVGSSGALLGALLTDRLTGWFGVGPMMITAMALPVVGYLVLAAVTGHSPAAVGAVAAGSFVVQFGIPVFNVNVVSFRQICTPDELLGRVTATARTGVLGAFSIGSLLGGALGSASGLRTTILVAAGGTLMVAAVLLFSPVRTVRRLHELSADPGSDAVLDADLTIHQQTS